MSNEPSHNLLDVETNLQILLRSNKKSWAEIYELIETVEKNELFKQKGYKSFTNWLENFAKDSGVSKQLLWKRKKAGKFYTEYREAAIARGVDASTLPPLNKVLASPDNIEYVEKISEGDTKLQDELIQRVLSKELKRTELKKAWQTVKAEREEAGSSLATMTPIYDEEEAPEEYVEYDQEDSQTEEISSLNTTDKIISVIDMIAALTNETEWLGEPVGKHNKFKTATEVNIIDDNNNERVIDMVVAETISSEYEKDMHIHGIEIRNTPESLRNMELGFFAGNLDLLWLAVPPYIVNEAFKVIPDGWGILSVERKNITVKREAKQQFIKKRDKKLAQALYKLL